jgi:putative hydrolase
MHTFASDGELSPIELIRRAQVNGYAGMAITDHVGLGGISAALQAAREDCRLARELWGLTVLSGVELTHLPAKAIAQAARKARELGAQIVVVHGETIVEPVEPGTNRAALECGEVDVLAHPGLLAPEDARLAAKNGVFLEISARKGHCLGNGRVASLARQAGARLLVNSDSHAPGDLLTPGFARSVALGAGLSAEEAEEALAANPRRLLARLGF